MDGAVTFNYTSTKTGVGETLSKSKVNSFEAYAEPFTGNIVINLNSVNIPNNSVNLKLEVLILKGKVVRNLPILINSQKMLWNGFDDHGNRVAASRYFIRLTVGKSRFQEAISLIRW